MRKPLTGHHLIVNMKSVKPDKGIHPNRKYRADVSTTALLSNHKPELSQLQPLMDLLVAHWHPRQIWLFGSRAKGTFTQESDWDLMVIVPDGEDHELESADGMTPWHLRRQTRIHADIVFCEESDFASYSQIPNTLAYEVAHTGLVIYDN